MTPAIGQLGSTVEQRAAQSLGTSADAIYAMIAATLRSKTVRAETLIDVGCGKGNLLQYVDGQVGRYVGADVVRYDGYPSAREFVHVDLDSGRVDLPDGCADVVVAAETIEHLENPRAFMRELVRLAKPNGHVVITTPNQLSLLSKLTLLFFNEFNAFRAGNYPAHITALLEIDLRRMARECGLRDEMIVFSRSGRIPGTPWHYPRFLCGLFPRMLSDNLLLVGVKG